MPGPRLRPGPTPKPGHEAGQFRVAHTHTCFWGNLSRRIIISNILGLWAVGCPAPVQRPRTTQRNKRILKWSFDMNYARYCNYTQPSLLCPTPFHLTPSPFGLPSWCFCLTVMRLSEALRWVELAAGTRTRTVIVTVTGIGHFACLWAWPVGYPGIRAWTSLLNN